MKCYYCQNDTTGFAVNADICNACPSTPIYYFNAVGEVRHIDYSFEFGTSEYVIGYSLKHNIVCLYNNSKIIMIFKDEKITSLQHAADLMNKFLKLKAFL